MRAVELMKLRQGRVILAASEIAVIPSLEGLAVGLGGSLFSWAIARQLAPNHEAFDTVGCNSAGRSGTFMSRALLLLLLLSLAHRSISWVNQADEHDLSSPPSTQ